MLANIIGFSVAAAAGVLICVVNYTISKKVLLKAPDKYSYTVIARQLLQVAGLAAVYLIASGIEAIDVVYPLIGAALGMTAPMLFFTKKLLSLNQEAVKEKMEDPADGREI